MKVGIISDAHHYWDLAGRAAPLSGVAGQFEQWATLFDEVLVCAPLLPGLPPATHRPYSAPHIALLGTSRAGGSSLRAKANLIFMLPRWWRAIRTLLKSADAVHIRCPNNISILGLLMLRGYRGRCHAIYTGNWAGYAGEPWTYRLQRVALRYWFAGPVSVYGTWPGQPARIVETFSPSISDATWLAEDDSVRNRRARVETGSLGDTLRLLTVGTLDRNKNQAAVIHGVLALRSRGHHAELRIVGDGPLRRELLQQAEALGVANAVQFLGKLDGDSLAAHYRWADFVVQPSRSEGFSKVTVEAMTYGAVPILSDLPVNRHIVDGGSRGATFGVESVDALVDALLSYAESPLRTLEAIDRCREYARSRTLDAWREHLRALLERHWSIA